MPFSESARELAFISLLKCDEAHRFSNLEIDSTIKKYGLKGSERALYTNLVYGVIERRITLDYFIAQFSSVNLEAIEKNVLCILRLGIYQLLYLDRIPALAACNEAVELCNLYSNKGASVYVNAVMREFTRHSDKLPLPDQNKEKLLYM